MTRNVLFFVFILQIVTQQNAYSQTTTDRRQQYTSIGDFPLENGQHIVDCKIGYRTFGKLNATRSNAIIYPTAGGSTTFMMQLFGAGTEVDTTRFYLILIDALGNGVSSSPSNSISQPKTLFPPFSIRDMVNTQYKMLTENLNIHHLAAIAGGSMGGLQALQWAVSYPDFMDNVVAIEATPKLSTYDLLWIQTYIEAVKSDTAYHGGNYTVNPASPLSVHLMQLLLTTPATLNNTVPADSFSTWLSSLEKPNPFTVDCNNFIWQTKAVMMHDISTRAGGSLENTAKMIKAKMLIIANKQDHIINQTLSIKFAKLVNAELVVMDNDLGHLIFNEKIAIEATRKFLSE
jgi:homoserine O-acetyltransferase/O-succinyltransferase